MGDECLVAEFLESRERAILESDGDSLHDLERTLRGDIYYLERTLRGDNIDDMRGNIINAIGCLMAILAKIDSSDTMEAK